MQIYKIESISKYNVFGATIELNYNELCDLTNALFELSQTNEKWNKNPNFLKLRRNFSFLFDLVKNSAVDNWTFEHCSEITQEMRNAEKALKERVNNA